MARITIAYRGGLAETIGVREEHIEAAKVSDVLHHLKTNHDKQTYRLAKAMLIAVNGVSILKKHVYNTSLEDGDVVTFLSLAAGG